MLASEAISARLRDFLEARLPSNRDVVFGLAVLLAGSTFWLAPRLPMVDLPQHVGQVALWHDLVEGTSKWQDLLYVNYWTPYLIGYAPALFLSFLVSASTALKLILCLSFFGFVAACVALRRDFGGDPRLDWLFIPGFFGYAYAWGFYTFLVAAPICLLFVLLANRYAIRPATGLGVALILADIGLFFSHGLVFIFANVIGGTILIVRTKRFSSLLVTTFPYLVVGAWCVVYARFFLTPTGDVLEVGWGWDLTRLNFLVFSIGWPTGSFGATWELGPIVILMLATPFMLGGRLNLENPSALVPLLVTLLVWVLVPAIAISTWLVYQRFALFLLPFYALAFRKGAPSAGYGPRDMLLPLLCYIVLLVHAGRLVAFAGEGADFEEVLAATQPGYRALGLVFFADSPATTPIAYIHFPSWYQAEKAGFVDMNFARLPAPIVRFRAGHEPVVDRHSAWLIAEEFDWERDQAWIYRYFFVRRASPLPPAYFPTNRCAPVLLKAAGTWAVYENARCHEPAP